MDISHIQIETERLILRLPRIEDFDGYAELHADAEAARHIGGPLLRAPAWRKSGMGLGIAQDIQAKSAPRPDKRFATYVYTDESLGASRLEEAKIAEVICA